MEAIIITDPKIIRLVRGIQSAVGGGADGKPWPLDEIINNALHEFNYNHNFVYIKEELDQ
jgi:hypothetical protein